MGPTSSRMNPMHDNAFLDRRIVAACDQLQQAIFALPDDGTVLNRDIRLSMEEALETALEIAYGAPPTTKEQDVTSGPERRSHHS